MIVLNRIHISFRKKLVLHSIFLIVGLLLPGGAFAKSRMALELYGQREGNRTSSYADQARSRVDQLNGQLINANGGEVKQTKAGGAGIKFAVTWPTSFHEMELGFSIGGGNGPSVITELNDSRRTAYREEVRSTYWRMLFEAERRRRIKIFSFSLKGGVGLLSGKAWQEITINEHLFSTVDLQDRPESKRWQGVTAEIIPSIGFGFGRHEIRLGMGWRYFPKVPALTNVQSLDSSAWSGSFSYSW